MKILTQGKDISELIEAITWSGDTKEVSRKVEFTVIKNKKDRNLPQIILNEGDEIILQTDDGKSIFGGIIFDIDKSASANVVSYLAYDLMFYINHSNISRVFDDMPENITSNICTELGIGYGMLAATGLRCICPALEKADMRQS